MKGVIMKLEECVVGAYVIIHKPEFGGISLPWLPEMDVFDGCLAVIKERRGFFVALENDMFPELQSYGFDPEWILSFPEYKPAKIEGFL